jgi:hypothetical protein
MNYQTRGSIVDTITDVIIKYYPKKHGKEKPVQKVKPSKPAFSIANGFWYFKAGYELQPKPLYIVQKKKQLTIKTSILKNDASFIPNKYLWWYTADNGKTWNIVPKSDGSDSTNQYEDGPNLTFTAPNTTGTLYIQQQAQVWPRNFNEPLWSNVARIDVVNDEQRIKKITDFNYNNSLFTDDAFKNQSHFPEVITDPEGATNTDDIRWKLDDNDLATIDPISGNLTINDNNKIGPIDVTAELPNTKIRKKKTFYISRILDGNTDSIFEDQPVNLKINDSFKYDPSQYKVRWHTLKNSDDEIIPGTDDLKDITLTFPYELNNGQIYVEFIDKTTEHYTDEHNNVHEYNNSFKSNPLTLHITPIYPLFATTQKISNDNQESNFSNNEVIHVKKDDTLTHTLQFKNKSPIQSLYGKTDAFITLPLSPNESVITGSFDTVEKHWNPDENNLLQFKITIPEEEMNKNDFHTIKVKTKIKYIDPVKNKFEYKSMLSVPANKLQSINSIEPHDIDFPKTYAYFGDSLASPDLKIITHPIDFGKILPYKKAIFERKSPDDTDEIIGFNDERKDKQPVKLLLDYSGKFVNQNNSKIIAPMHMIFFKNHTPVTDQPETIIETKLGEPLSSIHWSKSNGLKLAIDDTKILNGSYKAVLSWTIAYSV